PLPAVGVGLFLLFACARSSGAQDAATAAPSTSQVPQSSVSCASTAGERIHCAADTSAGVALTRSTGTAPCLLGKTWGYDDSGIWVAEGCSGEFIAGQVEQKQEKTK